jgi:hypothetical protein
MSLLVVDESHLLQRDYDNHLVCNHSIHIGTAISNQVPRKLCRESCLTEEPFNTILKERIGRRKEEDGKVIWISQPKWEDEKRRLEGEESRQKFPFRLDDSEKKSKIVISSPALVTVVQRMIPQRLFESVSDEVAIEEPFASLFHFVDDMRKDMISRRADTKDMDDIDALEYFLYESQPQYKKARDALGNGRTALVSFETLWALFKAGEFIITTDKFEEKRLFKFTHLEEKHLEEKSDRVSGGRDLCVKLSVCGWCISWDREHKCFSQKSCIFYIERFLGHRNVRSLPVYPLRCEEEETRKSLVADLEKRGRNWTQLASNTPCCFEYDGTAIEIEIRRLSRHRSEMNTQVG